MNKPEVLTVGEGLQGTTGTRHIPLSPTARAILSAVLLFFAFMVFMGVLQFSTPDMPDNDGFYHIRLAYLMRTQGLKPPFPYLPLSILNEREYSDHHFLYHVALIPFTFFNDLRLGAKWSAVFFASLAFLSVWWLFYRQKVPYAGLWALGILAVSQGFLFRMSVTRAQSLSLAVLALGLSLLLERRWILLGILSFIYVWMYDAFPLMLVVVGAYALTVLILERRLEWRPVVAAVAGIGLGLIINPYFPHNLIFLVRHLLPKLNGTTQVSVGIEWYPYDMRALITNTVFALVAFVEGIIAIGLNKRRIDVRTATSLLLAIISGVMLIKARRFVEYFPPFALIFAAFAWAPLIQAWQKNRVKPDESGGQDQTSAWWKQPILRRYWPVIVLAVLIIVGMAFNMYNTIPDIRASSPYTLFAGASAWLKNNTPTGSMVFQTDWDDFPRLFYYNTHNTYLIGLDPTYMSLYNADLYNRWVAITRGQVNNPSQEIHDRFGAQYIVTDTLHTDFINIAEKDPHIKEVYRDNLSVVYQITN